MTNPLESIDVVALELVTGGSRFPMTPEQPRCDRPGCIPPEEPSPTFPAPPFKDLRFPW